MDLASAAGRALRGLRHAGRRPGHLEKIVEDNGKSVISATGGAIPTGGLAGLAIVADGQVGRGIVQK